jgi:hypothetical protein
LLKNLAVPTKWIGKDTTMRSSYLLLGTVIVLLIAIAAVIAWLLIIAPGAVDPKLQPKKTAALSFPR